MTDEANLALAVQRPTVGPVARGGGGDITGNGPGQGFTKASPVPAPAPMFRVSAVLRRYDADVPPTAVGACGRRRLGPACAFSTRIFAAAALSAVARYT